MDEYKKYYYERINNDLVKFFFFQIKNTDNTDKKCRESKRLLYYFRQFPSPNITYGNEL